MNYLSLYEKNVKKLKNRPALKKVFLALNKYLTFLFVGFYAGFFAYAIFSDIPLKEDFPFFLLLPLATLALVSALRILISKPRPYCKDGANVTPLLHKKNGDYLSSPSRHIACAVSIALAFLPFSLPIAVVLLLTSAALAYLRFAVGVHYVSDLIFGACVPCALFLALLVLKTFL